MEGSSPALAWGVHMPHGSLWNSAASRGEEMIGWADFGPQSLEKIGTPSLIMMEVIGLVL